MQGGEDQRGERRPVPTEDGVFWIAGNDQQSVRGRLTYGPEQTPELALYGPLTPAYTAISTSTDDQGNSVTELEPAAGQEDLTVHGFLRETPRPVSLVGCTTRGRRSVEGLGVQFEDQMLSARYMIRRAHVSGSSEEFSAVRLRVAHLDEWLHLPGFMTNTDTEESVQLVYKRPEELSATMATGETVDISHDLSRSWPQPTGGHISRDSWIKISGFEPATVQTIERRYVTPATAFANLAMGVGAPLVEVELQLDDRWCPMLHSGLASTDGLARAKVHDFLLPLAGIDLANLAAYIDLAARLGPLGSIVADSRSYLRRANLESQVLELTTVAEGMHRILYPEDYRFTSAESKAIRDTVRKALDGHPRKFWDVLRGFLTYVHEPN